MDKLLDRNGKPVVVKRIPMSTGRSKFSSKKQKFDNTQSPFERFKDSNNAKGRTYSF